MDIEGYIQSCKWHSTITLIGPLYASTQIPKGPKIFVDGGTRFRLDDDGFSIGDSDSYDGPLDQTLSPQKDRSDLAVVLDKLGDGFETIHLLGFSGGRKDHELMNWSEVHQFLKRKTRKTAVHLDQSIFAFSVGHWRITINGVFSIFAFEPTTLNLMGKCEYPLTDGSVFRPLTSHGLSNHAYGEIELTCGDPVFLFVG